ncbi:membrane protein [Desulfohalovibrio reitneri]|uniref:membrane protein n=1 Tax=Desulfohalovibrio reitneri TaxID=1307759 RepID=UPI0004A734B3|nr:membrane protein [Desulfohalovibrio reitneri]
MDPASLWDGLGWPLLRLTFFISLGLIVGNLIEALNWTHAMARIASPLIRLAKLKDVAGASFSMAFFSGVSANTMLAEAHKEGKIDRTELVLSNLFNALPTYLLHLPTVFFITLPFIGMAAAWYVGLSLCAAVLRTAVIIAVGRLTLPPIPEGCVVCRLDEAGPKSFASALGKAFRRFKKRIPRILFITVPVYTAIFFANRTGLFDQLESFLANNVGLLSWLHPKTFSIVVFQIASEFTAGLAVAGALLEAGSLPAREIVLALLVGNILSSPMRAFRHQFPYYAGIYTPALALRLMVFSQGLRVLAMSFVTWVFYVTTI